MSHVYLVVKGPRGLSNFDKISFCRTLIYSYTYGTVSRVANT